jgi:hypothetical protein
MAIKLKQTLTTLAVTAAAILASGGTAQADSIFDIGAGVGAAHLGDATPLEAIFQVDLVAHGGRVFGTRFVVVRTDGEFTVGEHGVRYVDLDFDVAEWRVGSPQAWGSLTAVGVDVNRNIPLNQELAVRLSFLGLKGKYDINPGDDAVVYIKGAADLLAFGYMSSAFEQSRADGYSTGFDLELGVRILKKVRIAAGQDFQALFSKPRSVYAGYECSTDTYYDEFGSVSYTNCGEDYDTVYDEVRMLSNTRLSVVADLHKHLQLFGRANYVVYSVRDDTGVNPNTTDSGFQFFLGLNARF